MINMKDTKPYLSKQIITYMGNKRKLLPHINSVIEDIKGRLGANDLVCGDGFSGSGIVSRLLKIHSKKLYTNDLAGYSRTINSCFLSTLDSGEMKKLTEIYDVANTYVNNMFGDEVPSFVSKHWSPSSNNVKINDRAYFTKENGERIDKYRYFIENFDTKYRDFLLASLLVECSIHNNTGGHFAAYYKKDGIGYFGGKNGNDLKRITMPIILKPPILHNNSCDSHISQQDTNEWLREIPMVDIMYFDPPYNKHPYNIYYFLLDIINDWDVDTEIPDTFRGQPKNWKKSQYNSLVHAEKAFTDLIDNTKAKYIVVSYNNDGIIPPEKMEKILNKKGNVEIVELEHKTYNRLKGMADYKRKHQTKKIKEFLWIVECN